VVLLKLLQTLVKTLNSEGTPGQVAAGMALGAALGLTPLVSLHNLVVLAAAFLLNVSIPGFMLGWAASVPFGFLLDPLFDAIGSWLLVDQASLAPLWTWLSNTPVLAWTGFTNTVVLGSFVSWLVAAPLLFLLARWGVAWYRATVYERLRSSAFFKAARASKLYNVYMWFRP
jgi:uncharacterized protein (TIGR03546 family)